MGDPVHAQDSTALPQRIGRYRILCELGTGSMATLYLARMTGLGRFERLFAVKITHEHLSKERSFVEMFMNEARIAAKIQHPNVIPVYEIDVERGRYYMVMDYVSGETLALTLKHTWNKDRPFPVSHAAQIIASACEGLHAAHELRSVEGPLGVVHRDVAPQNLMIGYDGIVRVMDFGIAKALDTISMTKPGMMKGTIAYMAPEQVRCQPIDRRVDVFALGAILWEATVGMRLFRHKNDVTTAARVIKMQIPPPTTVRKGYPIELERIVMKSLQRDKEQRYQTAREMGEDLAEFLHKSQERVTPAVIGAFLMDVFPDQLKQRQLMEQRAREVEPPSDLTYTPADISADSLLAVNADDEIELDDLEGPVSFGRLGSGPKATATLTMSKAVKIGSSMQYAVPTMIVRDRTPKPEVEHDEPLAIEELGVSEAAPFPQEPDTMELERAWRSGPVPEMTEEDVPATALDAPRKRPPFIAIAVGVAFTVLIAGLLLAGQSEEAKQASPPPRPPPVEKRAVRVDPPPEPPPARIEPPTPEEPLEREVEKQPAPKKKKVVKKTPRKRRANRPPETSEPPKEEKGSAPKLLFQGDDI